MQASFYTFSKRENSTKQPGSSPWSPEVNLKQPCGKNNIELRVGSSSSWEEVTSYNYLKFGGRYYYITEWTSERNDYWRCTAVLDLLSTYKENILNTAAFVEYAADTNSGWIIDNRLSMSENPSYSVSHASLNIETITGGSFILCVTGEGGSVQYYALSQNALANLLDNVSDWASIQVEAQEDSMREFILAFLSWARNGLSSGNAPNNIRGCVWVPWNVTGESEEIVLGNFHTGQAGRRIDTPVKYYYAQLEIPWISGGWKRSGYATVVQVYLPFCGVVSVDPAYIQNSESVIYLEAGIDFRSGGITYGLSSVPESVFATYSGSCGTAVPIGVSNVSPQNIIGGVFNTAVNLSSGNMTGAVSQMGKTANNILVPQVTTVGTMSDGSASVFDKNCACWVMYRPVVGDDANKRAVMGNPVMEVQSLNRNGFVKTRGASVEIAESSENISRINSMLDGGVYIE